TRGFISTTSISPLSGFTQNWMLHPPAIRRNYRFRELREVDPGGYRVVMILAGGPALLDDSAHVRLLFEAPKADPKPAPEELLQAALAAAGSDDARTRSFAILELSLRPEWLALMDADDAKLIQGYLASGELAPDSKNVLFELAAKLPAKLRDPWLAEEARHTLDALQPEFDLTTFVPRLAKTVLGILEEQGGEADSARVAPFLAANNPGVVEAALEALDRVDAKLARERAKAVLEQRDLHAESRRLLSEYLG
ncbi:MAG: hypothetical protein AAF560_32840, partial [Acidobacteriota bacterium]